MKLQVKLALYNAVSKAIIVVAFGLFLPGLIEQVVFNHLDNRLFARSEKLLLMIQRGGLDEIALDQDCSFDSYNIFKEEYVSISPLEALPPDFGNQHLENAERIIEGEVIKHRILSQAFVYDKQIYNLEIGEGLSSVEQFKQTIRKFSIWILIVVIIISIFSDLAFVRLILQPFYKIVNDKLQRIGHPSGFSADLIKTNTYEFSYLDKSINNMMQKVKDAFLVEQEFITNVSHELQTPISILHTRIENIISDPQVSDETKMKMVESQKTLSRLSRIIKALLYISKIENEQFVRTETVNLKNCVQDVLNELEDRITDKKIKVHQLWTSDPDISNSNNSLMHTMIFNVISNAIKYNKEGGEIYIEGQIKESCFNLLIKDTGVGIDDKQIPMIFDRFKRFRPDDMVSYGLGLPIVKSIAHFLGIEIAVASELNKETKFTFSFRN